MRDFTSFYNKHKGENIIVIGCGVSSNIFFNDYSKLKITTIGVNDVCSAFNPTYLLVVDKPIKFSDIRKNQIQNNKCDNFITQLIEDWNFKDENKIIKISLGSRKLQNFGNTKGIIDISNNSPYMACIIAHYMGAKNIGLVGVDWTDNHFNNNDGKHLLIQKNMFKSINDDYKELYTKLRSVDCKLFNLSEISTLTSLPKINYTDFMSL